MFRGSAYALRQVRLAEKLQEAGLHSQELSALMSLRALPPEDDSEVCPMAA